jgi:hypothetical protein
MSESPLAAPSPGGRGWREAPGEGRPSSAAARHLLPAGEGTDVDEACSSINVISPVMPRRKGTSQNPVPVLT